MEFCQEVLITDDTLCEGDETFNIVAMMVDGGAAIPTNSPQTVTIEDDDGEHWSRGLSKIGGAEHCAYYSYSFVHSISVAQINASNSVSIPENIGTVNIPLWLMGQKAPGRECVVIATTMDDSAVSTGTKSVDCMCVWLSLSPHLLPPPFLPSPPLPFLCLLSILSFSLLPSLIFSQLYAVEQLINNNFFSRPES